MTTLASHTGLLLEKPQCEPGVGALILKPDAPGLIEGIQILPYAVWPDDRGYFLEVMRGGKGLVEGFGLETMQVSASFNYPGTIKAFHFHVHQADVWVPCGGMLQVALIDLRKASPTFGHKNTLYVGELRPWQLRIPPGVAHGYKVVSPRPSTLVYVTDRTYNPDDEGRIPYNDPILAYDWETQHK